MTMIEGAQLQRAEKTEITFLQHEGGWHCCVGHKSLTEWLP
jgi:hypothetical protein